MTQFDVHRRGRGSGGFYLVNVQSDLLSELETRLVIPAYTRGRQREQIARLNPVIQIGGEPHVLATQELAAISAKLLGEPTDNVAAARDRIFAAIDLLVTGI